MNLPDPMATSSPPDVLILQHVRPEPPGTIADALDEHPLSHQTVKIHRDDPVPDRLEAEGLVLMGGPMGVGEVGNRPHLKREINLIEQALRDERPLLGICLGSQLLAHVLGAEVQSAPAQEIGWAPVTLTEAAGDDPLFRDLDDSFPAFHWHGDVFTLPDGATRLARTNQTEHQAFRYGDHAYGLLFHLEVTPKTVGWMTKAFQDELAEEGLDGTTIRQAAMTHEAEVQRIAETVFGRWARLVSPAR